MSNSEGLALLGLEGHAPGRLDHLLLVGDGERGESSDGSLHRPRRVRVLGGNLKGEEGLVEVAGKQRSVKRRKTMLEN